MYKQKYEGYGTHKNIIVNFDEIWLRLNMLWSERDISYGCKNAVFHLKNWNRIKLYHQKYKGRNKNTIAWFEVIWLDMFQTGKDKEIIEIRDFAGVYEFAEVRFCRGKMHWRDRANPQEIKKCTTLANVWRMFVFAGVDFAKFYCNSIILQF